MTRRCSERTAEPAVLTAGFTSSCGCDCRAAVRVPRLQGSWCCWWAAWFSQRGSWWMWIATIQPFILTKSSECSVETSSWFLIVPLRYLQPLCTSSFSWVRPISIYDPFNKPGWKNGKNCTLIKCNQAVLAFLVLTQGWGDSRCSTCSARPHLHKTL